MKLLVVLFILISATLIDINAKAATNMALTSEMRQQVESTSSSTTLLRGTSRFLAQQNVAARMTCDKFPRVCRLKRGEGPDCCKKKCVNVKTDRFNCGMCGYKCKYTETCCKGKCVDASFDKRHCGGCNNKCKKGQLCVYGMCNYA